MFFFSLGCVQDVQEQISTLSLDAGNIHVCALQDGELSCWGGNLNGESTPPQGVFQQVRLGSYHSCARDLQGAISCWGNDTLGQSSPPEVLFVDFDCGGIVAVEFLNLEH